MWRGLRRRDGLWVVEQFSIFLRMFCVGIRRAQGRGALETKALGPCLGEAEPVLSLSKGRGDGILEAKGFGLCAALTERTATG